MRNPVILREVARTKVKSVRSAWDLKEVHNELEQAVILGLRPGDPDIKIFLNTRSGIESYSWVPDIICDHSGMTFFKKP